MIAVTTKGYAFVYFVRRFLVATNEDNYGRGKDHWFEYLGRLTKKQCRQQYPQTPVLEAEDPRINAFCQGKVLELAELVDD